MLVHRELTETSQLFPGGVICGGIRPSVMFLRYFQGDSSFSCMFALKPHNPEAPVTHGVFLRRGSCAPRRREGPRALPLTVAPPCRRVHWARRRPTPGALAVRARVGGERRSPGKAPVPFRDLAVSPTRPETEHFPVSNFLFFAGLLIRPVWGESPGGVSGLSRSDSTLPRSLLCSHLLAVSLKIP